MGYACCATIHQGIQFNGLSIVLDTVSYSVFMLPRFYFVGLCGATSYMQSGGPFFLDLYCACYV